VAVGDIDVTDGAATSTTAAEIITGSGKGMVPTVGIYDLAGGGVALRRSFYAFPTQMTAPGIYVAVGDYNGDGVRDVVVTPGSGVAPKMNIFSGRTVLAHTGLTEKPTWSLPVTPTSYRGGLSVLPVPKNGGNPFAVEWDILRPILGAK